VTILSVNKTREPMGALCAHFFDGRKERPFSFFRGTTMQKKAQNLVRSAIIAALYTAMCHAQNLLFPGSASWAIQFRVAEALCVLAFFTPTAISGLGLGCLVFNLTSGMALPADFILGSLASVLAAGGMWYSRNVKVGTVPLPGLLLPALANGLIIGWELDLYIGGGFWLNAIYVAIGEAAVLLTLGNLLYFAMKKRHLDTRLFG